MRPSPSTAREVQVFAVQLLLAVLNGDGLAVRNGLLGVLGVLIEIHGQHLYLALVEETGTPSAKLFRQYGIDKEKILRRRWSCP